ncbi:MAG TPA: biotin--[acetyl-CoA-carboxylase] ligase [Bacteroidia bacterium]|nr:biotin--[acetyl-CoA-carboxylase] ligase [Bacteroidia bacterium]
MIGFKAGNRVIHMAETDSTNSFASRLLHLEIPEEGTVIMADFQKAGRGQRGSGWVSEAGKNLLISYILYPNFLKIADQFSLNQAISLAVCEFIRKSTRANVYIKWPNDILAGEGKVAGILVENSLRGTQISHSIIGIGINVNQLHFEPFATPASSLSILEKREFNLNTCLKELNTCIEKWYSVLRISNFKKLNDDYASALFRNGIKSEFEKEGHHFWGTITGVNAEGKLQIIHEDGSLSLYNNKEIKFIF